MNTKYSHYMDAIHPSQEFCSRLERELNLELRKKNSRSKNMYRLGTVAALAAVMLTIFGAVLRMNMPHGQVIDEQSNVLSQNATLNPVESSAPPEVLYELKMLDETVAEPKTDVNYCYLSVPLFNQTMKVYSEDLSDSHVLQPGDVYWPVSTGKTAPAEGLEFIRWWNTATNALQEGWAENPVESESVGACEVMGFPGKVCPDGAELRYGPSHEAPVIIPLAEGQYLHLYFRRGNWTYASTAPFDQEIEAGIPNAGWVYVEDIQGLAYADEDKELTEISTVVLEDVFDYPDDALLDLEMSSESAFVNGIFENSVAMFEGTLVGANDSAPVEIHATGDVGSPVLATIYLGDAYWFDVGEKQGIPIADKDGNSIGCAQRVVYFDETTDALEEGWIHTVHNEVPEETDNNPVEKVLVLGKVCGDRVPLRNGRSANAPAVAVLEKGAYLGLLYRNGNWMFAMTDPAHPRTGNTLTGWIHVTEVIGLQQRTPIDQVDLLADRINIRNAPDGDVIETIARSDVDAGEIRVRYLMTTLPGKNGNWHYVSIEKVFSFQNEIITGYIFEEFTALNTIELREELPMEGIVTATLCFEAAEDRSDYEETIEGERLKAFTDRLGSAMSESVYTDLCTDGDGTITFTYSDGRTETVSIAGDQCTNIKYHDVVYDYKTVEERQVGFLSDGGVTAKEILPQYFEGIQLP